MKRLQGFIAGIVVASVFTTMPVFAGSIDALFNQINIKINGVQVTKTGENFKLQSGETVPYSISYNGTTYLPMRKIAELFGKDVQWDQNTNTANIGEKSDSPKAENTSTTDVLNYKLYYNEKQINTDIILKRGTDVFLGLRSFSELLGYTTNYDNGKITIKSSKSILTCEVDKSEYYFNGEKYSFKNAPMVYQGRTLIPASSICKIFGVEYTIDEDNKTINIGSDESLTMLKDINVFKNAYLKTEKGIYQLEYSQISELKVDNLENYYCPFHTHGQDNISYLLALLNNDYTVNPSSNQFTQGSITYINSLVNNPSKYNHYEKKYININDFYIEGYLSLNGKQYNYKIKDMEENGVIWQSSGTAYFPINEILKFFGINNCKMYLDKDKEMFIIDVSSTN